MEVVKNLISFNWAWLLGVRMVTCDWSVVMSCYRKTKLTVIKACICASRLYHSLSEVHVTGGDVEGG